MIARVGLGVIKRRMTYRRTDDTIVGQVGGKPYSSQKELT